LVRRFLVLAFALSLIVVLIMPERLSTLLPTARAAATFTVNSFGDTFDAAPGNGICADSLNACTLRAALQEANALSGDDTINFSVTGTINLTAALPDITSNMTVNGPGSSLLTVRRDTGGNYRIFNITAGTVRVSGVTVTNGRTADGAPGASFAGVGGTGGGISNTGTLTLTDVTITANRTGNGGLGGTFGGSGGFGAGISSTGTLTMTNCVVSNNTTGDGASGDYGGSGGRGGGVYFSGSTLVMVGCSVTGNLGGTSAMGFNGALGGGGGPGAGLYINQGTIILTNTNISSNIAGDAIQHPTGSDGGEGGGIYTSTGVTTTMTNCVVGNNSGGKGGTGFASQGGFGGGIYNNGPMTMTGCLINGNVTKGPSSGGGALGGGIFNAHTLTMVNCTVSGNATDPVQGSRGGGIYNIGSTLTLINSTITGNTAFGNCAGCTFESGQGIHTRGTTKVSNTIIAGNGAGPGPDVTGNYVSLGHNLIGSAKSGTDGGSNGDQSGFTNGVNGDQVGTQAAPINAPLGALADNGGPTFTHALLSGSPALDAGDNSLAKDALNNPLTTDQRGTGRIASSTGVGTATVDIGSYEFHPYLEDVPDKTTNEDASLSFFFGVGDGSATVTSVTAVSDNPTLVTNLLVTGSGAVRALQITLGANQFGSANITLTVTESGGTVRNDSFLLTVNPVNDAPSFTKGADATANEDSGPQTVAGWATNLSSGPGESGQSLSFQVTSNTNPSLFSTTPAVNSSGDLTFTPAANANGNATITLTLKDDGGTANGGQDTSVAQTFKITISPVNDPPTANGQTIVISEDSPRFISFTGSDIDGDVLSYAIVSNPTNGTLSGSGTSRTYTPAANFSGSDSFTFKAIDPSGAESAAATIAITITAVNDSPVNTVPAQETTNQQTPLVFSSAGLNAISVADVDAGTDILVITLNGSQGTLTLGGTAGLTFITGDGTEDTTMSFSGSLTSINAALNGLTLKPNQGYFGTASVQITSNDQGHNGSGGFRSDTDTVFVTVRPGGKLQFNAATYSAAENAGPATVTVTRTTASFGATSVDFATSNGTATGGVACGAGIDYVSKTGTLSWGDGDSAAKTFTVTLCADSLVEADETVSLTLSNTGGSTTLGPQTTATLTLFNDDGPVLLTEANTQRAIALDLVQQTREPFTLRAPFNLSSDTRRRVAFFAWLLFLEPGENASAVTAQAEDDQGVVYPLVVESVVTLDPNWLTQVVVRLPDAVAGTPRDLWVTITLRGATSNKAIIKISGP
jgi:CSLREA domain-containing protein